MISAARHTGATQLAYYLLSAGYPEPCKQPSACLGAERRIWVVGVGRQTSPYQAVTPAQAAVPRPRYQLSLVKHQRSLTMFLLTRAENPARPANA